MNWRVLPFLILGACSSAARPAVDAGWDSLPRDARLPGDTEPPTPAVDFTVANCPETDVQKGSCKGTAPFTIQFIPVASSGITRFLWDFGDAGSADVEAPWHTFDSPGTFDITLRGVVATGLVMKSRPAFIEVVPSPEGSPCLRDEQCDSKTCLCSTAKPCSHGPVNGLCSSLCQTGSCPDDQVCVNLVTTASNARAEPWQTQVCLPSCERDTDCPAGLICRPLPAWPNAATRVKGCFVDVPRELGSSCVDSANRLRNDLCLSGLCANLGALGLCSRDCSSEPCPTGSECALFGDGRSLCLLPCSSTIRCDADPLLSCVAAGPSLLGFKIQSAGNSGAVYCAPKPCVANTDCGAVGVCQQASGGGHCVSRN
jgi:PKD repeat protein